MQRTANIGVRPFQGINMSRLKELLEQAKKRSILLEKQKELQKQAQIISQEIDLNPERRGDNLRLLRAYMNEYQDNFVAMLGIGSQSNYSKLETGDSLLDDIDARRIESDMGLPIGWLERNNGDAIFLSNDEFQLIKAIRQSPPEATLALTEAVRKLSQINSKVLK